MQKFELVLINEKVKQYRLFALLIIILNCIAFSYLAVTRSETRFWCIGVVNWILALFIIQHFAKKRGKEFNAKAGATLVIIAAYLTLKFWWPAAIISVLAILYIISIRRFIVSVAATQIIYPSYPKKTIQWNELNNIIMKDGLLTLDFKNNKLIQVLVSKDKNNKEIDERNFNDFCRKQLSAASGS
jgi:hypothetical protein